MPDFEVFDYGNPEAGAVLIQMVDEHDMSLMKSESESLASLCGNGTFYLKAVKVADWNRDLSPWNAPAVFGNAEFGDGAEDTLDFILNGVLSDADKRPVYIGGYSLSALFALWAGYRTDRFCGIAAASPSVWFPGFTEYMRENTLFAKRVYLSLGDREERTRNPVTSAVGAKIRECHEIIRGSGADCILEWNPGNHFAETEKRTAKAFAWLLNGGGGGLS